MGLEIDRPSEGDVLTLPITVTGTCSQDHEVRVDVGPGMYSATTVANGTNFSITVPANQDTMIMAGEIVVKVTCSPDEEKSVGITIQRPGIPR